MASWQSFLMCTMLRFTMKRSGRNGLDIAKTRAGVGTPRPQVLQVPAGWTVGSLSKNGLTFETVERANGAALRNDLVVLYLHGGGYFFGSPQTHRQLGINMARHCDAPVYSLDYRLAPEHRYPAALDDAVAAAKLLTEAFPSRRLLIGGDSAGGGLALATAVAMRDRGLRAPAALVLFSPWTDLAGTGASLDENTRRCAMFTGKGIREASKIYLGTTDARDPGASPLYADLHGLPPMQIFASTDEVLRDDSTRLAAKAKEQGVSVELHLVRGVPHIWPLFARVIPEGRESLRQVAAFVARVAPRTIAAGAG